jgi:hypothetical protein
LRPFRLILIACLAVVLATAGAASPLHAEDWLADRAGRLEIVPAANGDRIPDFSSAGYGAPGTAPPVVAEAVRLAPQPGAGDRAAIQAAIDAVSARPLPSSGLRGAVVLAPGIYRLDGPLQISASGVVLRGSGSGDGGTVLSFEQPPGPVIRIEGAGRWRATEAPRAIVDAYVPVGADVVTLEPARGLAVGDRVIVQRPFTAAFVAEIGMDQIPPRAGRTTVQWKPGRGLLMARTIVSVAGDTVGLDAPVVDAIEAADGGTLWKYEFPGEITDVGLESLSIDGTAVAPVTPLPLDQGRALRLTGVLVDKASDGWVRDVGFRNLSSYVVVDALAREITLEDVHGRNDVPPWWPVPAFAFSVDGQRTLVRRCSVTAENMMLATTQSRAAGPIVFQDCEGQGPRVSAGPHQRWAAGILFDNIDVSGSIAVVDRGNMGSGQGWAGANVVVWNSAADRGFHVASPPTAHTWVIGATGEILPDPDHLPVVLPLPPGAPRSLFDAQVSGALVEGANP